MNFCYISCSLLLLLFVSLSNAQNLPALNIAANLSTISGVSAGGAMAIQLHVAYSSKFIGLAVFAGIPYYCALDELAIALTSCTQDPLLIDLDILYAITEANSVAKLIDNPSNLKSSQIWLWSGTQDTVVVQGVMDKVQTYYQNYIPSSNIVYWNNISSEHAWITNFYGNGCGFLGSPYISNCAIDAAGQFIAQFFGAENLKPRGKTNESNIFKFSQGNYIQGGSPSSISLADHGYVYIPTKCWGGNQQCLLHVTFHGCNQNYNSVGMALIKNSGINEWAETNNVVVLYPQTSDSSFNPLNPDGCFDWWGYNDINYATKQGAQIQSVMNMLTALGLKQ